MLLQALCIISKPWVNSNWSCRLETLNSGQNRRHFVSCELEIWWMTSEKTGLLLYTTSSFVQYFKAMGEFKLELQSRNTRFGSKSVTCVTLEFDGWPWKTIGHLLCGTSSFVHRFIAISESKLGLQSGNAQFGSKLAIFFPVWPWNLTDDLKKQQGTSSMLHQALCILP